jgi:hypothetical protein
MIFNYFAELCDRSRRELSNRLEYTYFIQIWFDKWLMSSWHIEISINFAEIDLTSELITILAL